MVVETSRNGKKRAWRLLDRYTAGRTAMSRTTGYTTAAVAMALARKQFNEPGVHPPEVLGRNSRLVAAIIQDLAERGVETERLCIESASGQPV